jgi:hypothetical protein
MPSAKGSAVKVRARSVNFFENTVVTLPGEQDQPHLFVQEHVDHVREAAPRAGVTSDSRGTSSMSPTVVNPATAPERQPGGRYNFTLRSNVLSSARSNRHESASGVGPLERPGAVPVRACQTERRFGAGLSGRTLPAGIPAQEGDETIDRSSGV